MYMKGAMMFVDFASLYFRQGELLSGYDPAVFTGDYSLRCPTPRQAVGPIPYSPPNEGSVPTRADRRWVPFLTLLQMRAPYPHGRTGSGHHFLLSSKWGLITHTGGQAVDTIPYSPPNEESVPTRADRQWTPFLTLLQMRAPYPHGRTGGGHHSLLFSKWGLLTHTGGQAVDTIPYSPPNEGSLPTRADRRWTPFLTLLQMRAPYPHGRTGGGHHSLLFSKWGLLTHTGGQAVDTIPYSSPNEGSLPTRADRQWTPFFTLLQKRAPYPYGRTGSGHHSLLSSKRGLLTHTDGQAVDTIPYSPPKEGSLPTRADRQWTPFFTLSQWWHRTHRWFLLVINESEINIRLQNVSQNANSSTNSSPGQQWKSLCLMTHLKVWRLLWGPETTRHCPASSLGLYFEALPWDHHYVLWWHHGAPRPKFGQILC